MGADFFFVWNKAEPTFSLLRRIGALLYDLAEAIGTQAAQGVADDTVLEEAQKGYTIGDELLRPAKVIVAKNAAE